MEIAFALFETSVNVLESALFLDIDGTLADIADSPADVKIDTGLLHLVERIHRTSGGAIALISGRSIHDVDRLFAPLRLAIAGQHGIERRDASGIVHTHAFATAPLREMAERVRKFAVGHPGVDIEEKGFTLAVHYRRAPDLGEQVRMLLEQMVAALDSTFRLQPGKMVLEVKPAGRDKGTAILEFMNEPPFHGRIPIFVGDDATDEYGFTVINRLGGHSIKVGPEPSVARWRLPDVDAARCWLAQLMRNTHTGQQ